jgi:hypothetical protein
MIDVGEPDVRQLASAQQARQRNRIPLVILDAISWLSRRHRGCADPARMPKRGQLPLDAIAARARLIDELETRVLTGQPPCHLCQIVRRIGDCREVSDIACATSFGNRDGHRCFVHIKSNKRIYFRHGQSPMFRSISPVRFLPQIKITRSRAALFLLNRNLLVRPVCQPSPRADLPSPRRRAQRQSRMAAGHRRSGWKLLDGREHGGNLLRLGTAIQSCCFSYRHRTRSCHLADSYRRRGDNPLGATRVHAGWH